MKLRLTVLLSVGMMVSAGAAAQTQRYTITDLGIGMESGENTSLAAALNNLGQAAVTFSSTSNPYASMATFISDETRVSLGTLGPLDSSTAEAINSSGEVAGYDYRSTRQAQSHAFVYSNGGMKDITSKAKFPFGTTATGINDSGEVVGYGWPTGAVDHAFLYTGGEMRDLGTIGGQRSDTSTALAINDAGQVVGNSTTQNGEQTNAFMYSNGVMTNIGPAGVDGSNAAAINAVGQVVGIFFVGTATHAALYSDGVWTDLGEGVSPTGINRSGEIVGTMGFLGGGAIYVNGKFVDLNSLIQPDSDYSITGAFAINDAGQILCNAEVRISGTTHAVLLTPE
jgi:probable HAF family extracellular repeat protein